MAYRALQVDSNHGEHLAPSAPGIGLSGRPTSTVSSLSSDDDEHNDHQERHQQPQRMRANEPTKASKIRIDDMSTHEDDLKMHHRHHGHRVDLLSWALELFAMFLSVGSLVAAAVVLAWYNNTPLSNWNGFVFSINTVISILGVVSKATLAFAVSSAFGQHKWNWFRTRQDELRVFVKFDEASRGPWGSFILLFWSRAR